MRVGKSRLKFQSEPFFMVRFCEACEQGVCPLCSMRDRLAWQRFDTLLWEGVTDPVVRNQIIAARGFCGRHARVLLRVAEKQAAAGGVAMIYEHLVRVLLEAVENHNAVLLPVKKSAKVLRRVAGMSPLTPNDQCIGCVAEKEAGPRDLTSLVRHLAEEATREESRQLFEKSGGLCLPHFEEAVRVARETQLIEYLRHVQVNQMTALHSDLAEFVRKLDYQVQDKSWGSERDSWRRAVEVCTGYRLE